MGGDSGVRRRRFCRGRIGGVPGRLVAANHDAETSQRHCHNARPGTRSAGSYHGASSPARATARCRRSSSHTPSTLQGRWDRTRLLPLRRAEIAGPRASRRQGPPAWGVHQFFRIQVGEPAGGREAHRLLEQETADSMGPHFTGCPECGHFPHMRLTSTLASPARSVAMDRSKGCTRSTSSRR